MDLYDEFILQIYQLKLSMGILIRNLTEANNDANKREPALYPQVNFWAWYWVTTCTANIPDNTKYLLQNCLRLKHFFRIAHNSNLTFLQDALATIGCDLLVDTMTEAWRFYTGKKIIMKVNRFIDDIGIQLTYRQPVFLFWSSWFTNRLPEYLL